MRKMVGRQLSYPFQRPIVLIIGLCLAVILVFSTLIAVALSRSMGATVQNSGRIILVGLDAHGGSIDSASGAVTVDLGEYQVGRSENISFYLRSISNVPITAAFSLDSWEPRGLESFMVVSWTYNGTEIAPMEEIPLVINIRTVASAEFVDFLIANHVTAFGFILSIYATES